MIITCPKYSYYSALNDEVKSSTRAKMKKVVSEYAKDKPTVFLEDTLAKALFGDTSNIISITDERDYSQMTAFEYYGDESYMRSFYNMYPHEICPFVKFENPPASMMVKDREQYREKRIAAYEKRLIGSVRYFAEKHKVILTFTGNSLSRGKTEIKPEDNDGILNIIYNLESNVTSCYYSGMWVGVDTAKQILGGLYG